jgi:DNA-binding transcriptional regulator YiaG
LRSYRCFKFASNYRSDRSLTGHQKYFFANHSRAFRSPLNEPASLSWARHGMVCIAMNALRRLRLQMELSQVDFATRLGVAEQTYRIWDSGRRTPPRSIVSKAKRLQETAGGLLPMQCLADEYGMHVRTLRKAAQDGRLQAAFSTRMVFGKLVAFASREAVETFKRRYYRQTTQWNRPPRPTVCTIPDDYDRVLVALRARLRLTQSALAERVGAASKAVVYQWESRRRRPSPVLWKQVQALR